MCAHAQDADVPTSKLRELYTVLVQDVRTMFQVCRLVHADLSEYNILYFAGRLAIIDVSQVRGVRSAARKRRRRLISCRTQSVDLDHPRCFDFLKEDLTHVNDFFSRRGALAGVLGCAARKLLSSRRGTAQAWRPPQCASCLTL